MKPSKRAELDPAALEAYIAALDNAGWHTYKSRFVGALPADASERIGSTR